MKKVIIDTDPGVDDALAILLAFNLHGLKIEAITTVVGNVRIDLANQNVLKILEFIGVKDVPVASGVSKPLVREAVDATEFHGKTGLGDAILPEPRLKLSSRTAVQVILEKAAKLKEELTLVSIGPLTNIALAVLLDPELMKQTAGLVIMGGAYFITPHGFGNANAVAEFNIWHDPEAAKIVFGSGVPIKAIGLDVTNHPDNRLTKDLFLKFEYSKSRRASLIADLCRRIVSKYHGLSIHDPMAVAVAMDPSLAKTERFKVDVETVGLLTRGMTVVDRRFSAKNNRSEANAEICVHVDSRRFLREFLNKILLDRFT